MTTLDEGDFKIAYASAAMPIRYAVERRQWAEAAAVVAPWRGTTTRDCRRYLGPGCWLG